MNNNLKTNSRILRKNMTSQERKLWYLYLKQHPLHWNRQKVIEPYILDFYCFKAKLGIEIDGSQHYLEKGFKYDERRTTYLNGKGLYILRFTNYEIDFYFNEVCEVIEEYIIKLTLPPSVTS